jgi:dihydroflavonol-4-reductase
VKVYVTGASGFIGGHVVDELEAQGADVRTDWVDILDLDRLARVVEGCEAVFHVAALYSYDADARMLERVNVEGTRNVVEACVRRSVRRLVHTSTAGTCGPVAGRAATELDAPPDWELAVPYKRTKLAAEELALGAAGNGLDVVVVNPTTPIGEGDRKPTPTGRIIADLVHGKIWGYLGRTGLNVVDVRDVARGHTLAFERGRSGERYLLGGVNLPLAELFAAVADLAGRPRPRVKVPYAAAVAAARAGLTNVNEVRLARLPMYFSSDKAVQKLRYRPGPVTPALARAVRGVLSVNGKGGA